MNPKCFCTGWSLVAGLAASVLALPSFATSLTLEEALRLATDVGRRNVMIKVPGTAAGIPAV